MIGSELKGPQEWAAFVNHVLETAFGEERFPVSIVDVATMLTPRLFPEDPISIVQGANLDGVDGILVPDPRQKKGWGIFFNSSVPSRRRIRFTLGHEFGHYLLHRHRHPDGFRCGDREISILEKTSRIEEEADTFSANFLMPPADLQRQIAPEEFTNLSMLSFCADRYGVSLQAMIRQWLRITRRRAMLVVSRDGRILWSEASETMRQSGVRLQNSRVVPEQSLAVNPDLTNYPREGIPLPTGSWFNEEETVEMMVASEQYHFTLSLLHLDLGDVVTP
ncbi:MAG: ImmA/IrrE family metallo-endopeptidase [Magnetococcales bacterium]|nr:ImmA/IrrE family metallo-endopeptidase [Magnetococcales bacterium]